MCKPPPPPDMDILQKCYFIANTQANYKNALKEIEVLKKEIKRLEEEIKKYQQLIRNGI